MYLVKLACERPELADRSLSQWDCTELARQLVEEGLVASISPQTVRRILSSHKLKPWRIHYWLSADKPREAEFYARVQSLIQLYTRELAQDEVVLSLDEKTSLQPRSRQKLEQEIHYLASGRERMDYARYEAAGWPIGSGAAQGECKHLVKERFCVTGAHWRRDQIGDVLALRIQIANGEWEAAWINSN